MKVTIKLIEKRMDDKMSEKIKLTREEKFATLLDNYDKKALKFHQLVLPATVVLKVSLIREILGYISPIWFSKVPQIGVAALGQGELNFYTVTGYGQGQRIFGHTSIKFTSIERIERAAKFGRSAETLTIIYAHDRKKYQLQLGSGSIKKYPNLEANMETVKTTLQAHNFEIHKDQVLKRVLLFLLTLFGSILVLTAIAYLIIQFFFA